MSPAKIREKLGISIEEMADLLEVHRETWAKWETSKRKPNAAARTLMRVFVWMKDNGILEQYLTEKRIENNDQ